MKPDPKHEAWLTYTDVLQFFESASFEMVFKAGWAARDKQGDEALGRAVEALSDISLGKKQTDIGFPETSIGWRMMRTAQEALAEIRKIMGDE